MKEKRKFRSVSLPRAIIEEVGVVVEELGYWPTETAFIRQAILEMLEKYRNVLERRRRDG